MDVWVWTERLLDPPCLGRSEDLNEDVLDDLEADTAGGLSGQGDEGDSSNSGS